MFTYNTWSKIGYYNLQTYSVPANELPPTIAFPANPSEKPVITARADWMQQLSMPFWLWDIRVAPYIFGDLTYYTADNTGSNDGRAYGGGGVRAVTQMSRLYEDIDSEFWNVHGIYHKMTFRGNYFNGQSSTPVAQLPQLDRLYDNATYQALQDVKPWEPTYLPNINGNALYTSPVYNPQLYAIRRLIDNRVDTMGTMQVVQGEIDQRWQTKRGYPGMEHTVDYFTFDLSASFYPAPNRDDFGHPISFVEWYSTWAAGDRNGITSNGWFDPWAFGTRYWNVVGYYNRPDGTNFNLSYRQFDPVGSRLVSGSISYNFSPKYAVMLSFSQDLVITSNQSESLTVTRTGTDLTWMIGFSYNAILNNFSFNFMVLPNLIAQRMGTVPGAGGFSSGGGTSSPGSFGGGRQ
jgi:hypothetical protein